MEINRVTRKVRLDSRTTAIKYQLITELVFLRKQNIIESDLTYLALLVEWGPMSLKEFCNKAVVYTYGPESLRDAEKHPVRVQTVRNRLGILQGITWTGGVVPGHHDDLTDASVNSPAFFGTRSSPIAHGGSDPVLVSAPCGRFYLAYMSFVRGGESRLLVSRFQDLNDSDSRHTIAYLGTSLVDKVNNATNGLFVDKPHMAVELTGNGSCSQVTENIHVSYTTFVGGARNKFTSKINVASSYDGGKTFTPVKIDDSYTQSQGDAPEAQVRFRPYPADP